jgi:preprotein translocase subunit SecY
MPPDAAARIVQSLGIAIYLERQTPCGGLPLVYDRAGRSASCMLTLTTGTMFIMWLGEQIIERGIGNGMSLIIFGHRRELPASGDCDLRQLRPARSDC